MSLLLAFDTSTPSGSVALAEGPDGVRQQTIGSSARHAESLLPAIAALLEGAGRRPADVTGVVVGGGPGSFTGVRIAAATARGLVRALGVPLYAYGSLLAEARAAAAAGEPVCALFDARRDEVYAGCYRFVGARWETLLAPQAATLDDVLARVRALAPRFAGEGAHRHAGRISGPIVEPVMTRAAALLDLARRWPAAGLLDRPAQWEPDYLRPPGAERIRR